MTQQAELLQKIDALPPEFFGEVIDFVGYLQKKIPDALARQETSKNNSKIRLTRKELDEMLQGCPHTLALSGILSAGSFAGSSDVGDGDLDTIRMERLAKHL